MVRLWQRVIKLYRETESRPRNYQLTVDFTLGIGMTRPRLTLHLEVVRMLQNKDRPRLLPDTFIKIALANLITCQKIRNDRLYLIKLKNNLNQG